MSQAHFLCLLAITAGYLLTGSAGVVEHIVGGVLEWNMPPNANFYDEWAQSRSFALGDKLVFTYRSGSHNVVEVSSKEDYEKCTLGKMIDTQIIGPSIVTLDTPGFHYYYCGIGTHCRDGMKLAVEVGGSKSTKPNAAKVQDEAGAPKTQDAATAPAVEDVDVTKVPAVQDVASAPAMQDVDVASEPATQNVDSAPRQERVQDATSAPTIKDESDSSINDGDRFIVLVGFVVTLFLYWG